VASTGTKDGRLDLAAVLRRLREASGLTGDRLAVRVGMSQSKVSRIENGRVLPSILDVERILTALEVPPEARNEVLTLARAANVSFIAWRTARQTGLAKRQAQVAAFEREARLIRTFQPALVPGLLQTPEYARAVLSLPRLAGERDLSAAVTVRVERQAVLYNPGKRFEFVLMESVLRGRLVPDAVLFAQLQHLATMARLPNVELVIVPQDAMLPDVPSNGFGLLDERVVIAESFSGEMLLRDPRDVALHVEVFEGFAGVAVGGEAALRLLASTATGPPVT
jgi:transcriptional regulator with XRE-family HTH domain